MKRSSSWYLPGIEIENEKKNQCWYVSLRVDRSFRRYYLSIGLRFNFLLSCFSFSVDVGYGTVISHLLQASAKLISTMTQKILDVRFDSSV
jgi:hypothetical protein